MQYPAIFRTVARYVGAEDFGEAESLTGRLARLVYEQVERDGKADEAAILSRLQDTADQTQAAEVFHTMDRSATDTERSKAIAETLLKVYRAASPAGIGFAGVVERRHKEQEIGKLEFRA